MNLSKLAPHGKPATLDLGLVRRRPSPKPSQLPGQIGILRPELSSPPGQTTNTAGQTSNTPGQSAASPGSAAGNPFGTAPLPLVPDKPRAGRLSVPADEE